MDLSLVVCSVGSRHRSGSELIGNLYERPLKDDLGNGVTDDELIVDGSVWRKFQQSQQDPRCCLPERLVILIRRGSKDSVDKTLRLVKRTQISKVVEVKTELAKSNSVLRSKRETTTEGSTGLARAEHDRALSTPSWWGSDKRKASNCCSTCEDLR